MNRWLQRGNGLDNVPGQDGGFTTIATATDVTLVMPSGWLYPANYQKDGESTFHPVTERALRHRLPMGRSTTITVVRPDPGTATVTLDVPISPARRV